MKKMLFTNNRLYHYSIFIVLLISGFTTAGYAASVPNAFTSGTVAKSSEVNANFNYLADRSWELNGNDIHYDKGNVGIGTANPTRKLVIEGTGGIYESNANVRLRLSTTGTNGEVGPGIELQNNEHDSGGTKVSKIVARDDAAFSFEYDTPSDMVDNDNIIMTLMTDGKVGIGTTSPHNILQVVNSDSTTGFSDFTAICSFKNTDTTDNTGLSIAFQTEDTNGTANPGAKISSVFTSHAAWAISADLAFLTSNAGIMEENMRITSAGNVGIGTTTPEEELHIANYATATDDRPRIRLENLNTSGDNGSAINFVGRNAWYAIGIDMYNDGGKNFYILDNDQTMGGETRVVINSSGNVGIGTMSPSYTLDVNGTIRGNNVAPSDIRLKENIKPIDNALDKVAHLRGVYFHWKDSEEDKPQDMGLIAQEVEGTFPEVVSEDQEGYKSINYGKLVGALVEAVKELKAQNEYLHERIKTLESKM